MKILALELSSIQRTAALMVDGRVCGVASQIGGNYSAALALVEDAFQLGQLSRDEIEIIAVGLGPGSYTGIRAAIALAQGWQLGNPVRLLGIGSATCLAAQAQTRGWF